jgi:hypothetical protein
VDSILAAAVKIKRELRYCAAPVYADAPVQKLIVIKMYHFHIKNEDLTNTFEPLAKRGKRMNVVVWANIQKSEKSLKSLLKTQF